MRIHSQILFLNEEYFSNIHKNDQLDTNVHININTNHQN